MGLIDKACVILVATISNQIHVGLVVWFRVRTLSYITLMENANIFYYSSGVSQLTDSFSLTHTANHMHSHWQEDVKKKKTKKGNKKKRTAEPTSINTKLIVTLQAFHFYKGLSSKCTRSPMEHHITKNWIMKSVSMENPNNSTGFGQT